MNCLRSIVVLLLAVASAHAADPATRPTSKPAAAEPPPGAIRVACIGDSITYGHGVDDREHQSYPMQLGRKLGDKYFVRNYGVNGTTALRNGDRPYVARPVYKNVLAYKPDILVIGLGTNDSKPQNWAKHETFAADYKAIIAAFREANPGVQVYICLPAPCFLTGNDSIRDSVLSGEIIPALKTIAGETGATTVDLHTALDGKKELFPDLIHPNAQGAGIIASTVAAAIAEH